MSDCLWNDIDTYLVAAVTADMGEDGDYETHQVQTVLVGETFDPDQHKLPAVLIRGLDVEFEGYGPHGDGAIHIDAIVYPYDLVAVGVADTVAGSKVMAAELLRRLREVVRSRFALGGLASGDGETVVDTVLDSLGRIEVRGRPGSRQGKYLGACLLPVDVHAKI